jgi:outer membrane lipoprotein-sorting protein
MNQRTSPGIAHERDIEALLEERLSALRTPNASFQLRLENRLLHQLADPAPDADRMQTRVAMTRRRFARVAAGGLASAAALTLALFAQSHLVQQPADVSAAELIDRAEKSLADPLSAGLKSFHLTSRSSGKLPLNGQNMNATGEQWFSPPNRTRTESRTTLANGATQTSGSIFVDGAVTAYATPGSSSSTITVMPKGIIWQRAESSTLVGPDDEKVAKREIDERFEKKMVCLKPDRKGETTVAGRSAYLVENTLCDPSESPSPLKGARHVMAIDKETSIPLRVENYNASGELELSYEVTRLEYDIPIAESIFTQIPADTEKMPADKLNQFPRLSEPGIRVQGPPTTR